MFRIVDRLFQSFQEYRKEAQKKKYKPKKVYLEVERLELRWLPSVVTFDSATYSVNEADQIITIQIDRDTSSGSSSVNYATSNGTAAAGTDYTSASGTATINNHSFLTTISIYITFDDVSDSSKTFTVTLSNPVNCTIGSPSTTTVTINHSSVTTYTATGQQRVVDPLQGDRYTFGNASIALQTGDFSVSSGFDYGQGGAVFPQPMLVYHSDSTTVRPILEETVSIGSGSNNFSTADVVLTWNNGTPQSAVTFTSPGADTSWIFGVQVSSAVSSTGLYPWSMTINMHFSSLGDIVRTVTGNALVVVNNGAFGNGWSIDGFNSLVAVSGGEMMVFGSGGARLFTGSGGTYTSPANDYGTLVKNGDNTFTYTAKDQTQWNYDTSGNLTTIVDPHSLARTFTYSGGNLSTVTEPDGGVTTFTYSSGKLATIVEPGNRTITITIDGSSNLTNIADADGSLRTFTYDSNHHITNDKWGSQNVTMTYDSTSGLLTNIDRGASNTLGITSTVKQTLNTSPACKSTDTNTSLTLPDIVTLTVTLDQQGRMITYHGANGNGDGGLSIGSTNVTITRDSAGNITVYTDALSRTTTYTYNSSGDLTQIQHPDSSLETFTYDSTYHEVLTHKDTLSNLTTLTYNTYGDLATIKDALGDVTTYTWSSGLLQSVQDANNNVTTLSYDGNRRLQTITDALNNVTTFTYDSAGNVQTVTDALGRVSTYSYDGNHRELTQTDPLSGIVTVTYNAQGQITSVTDQLSRTTSYVYNAQGWLSTETDAVGTALSRTTTYTYLPVGYVSTVTDALNHTTTYTYTIYGDVATVTDPLNHVFSYSYDADRELTAYSDTGSVDSVDEQRTIDYTYNNRGWLTNVQDALNNLTTFTFDTQGNLLTSKDANNGVTTYSYDALDRLVAVTDPLNHTSTTVYDAIGNVQVSIDALNNRTTYSYDADNQLQTVKDALSNVSTYVYDAVGNVVNTIDGAGDKTTYAYDSLNRRVNTIEPNGSKTTFVYDAASQLSNLIDPDSNKTTFVYDALGRQTQEIDALGKIITYTYNAADLLTEKKDRLGQTIDYTYDAANRLTAETWKNSGGTTTNMVTYTYDKANQLLSAADGQGAYTFTYDAGGQVHTQKDMWGDTLTFTYDAVGNRTKVQDNFSGLETSTYDAANNLSTRKFSGIGGSSLRLEFSYTATNELQNIKRYNASSGGSLIGQTTYTYDNALRLSGIKNADGSGTSLSLYTYTYDNANRLSTEQLGRSTTTYSYDAASQLTNDGVNTYAYDSAGNRNNNGQTIGTGNRLSSDNSWTYSYDNEGNLIQKVSATGPTVTWTYHYDVKNRLTDVHETAGGNEIYTVTYTYDVFNDRISQAEDSDGTGPGAPVTTHFAWEGEKVNQDAWQNRDAFAGTENWDIWADLDGSNNLKMRYVRGDTVDQLFARIKSDGTVAWYLTDRMESVRQMVDATGAVQDTIAYDGLGNIISESNASFGDRWKWTGRETNNSTGLLYSRARYYNSNMEKWVSEDPARFLGGDYNLLRFSANLYQSYKDPSGLDAFYLFDPKAPLGFTQGHMAILVGNDQDGWNYYSWAPAQGKNSSAQIGGKKIPLGNMQVKHYDSLPEAMADKSLERFSKFIRFRGSAGQDKNSKAAGDQLSSSVAGYLIAGFNCCDVSSLIGSAGSYPPIEEGYPSPYTGKKMKPLLQLPKQAFNQTLRIWKNTDGVTSGDWPPKGR
jgi:RHS repeat-associated protein